MPEILSPNHTQTQRLPRIQSPTTPFFLPSNDDQLERAQARAARATAIRHKTAAFGHAPQPPRDPCLDKQQIVELFHNCIKLASENKINQKNTWELNLIDHLYNIVKAQDEEDVETSFQNASCTLEAGVKIYSLRVDSVYSEAYKVLGGINRVCHENEQDAIVEDANVDNEQEESRSKKEAERKISPLSTLESSFEALNAKKFDVAFAVDPLYHQTSAQFDEGGAKGLLLSNLGLYGGCRVLFDSQEVPGKCMLCENKQERLDTIDLSFAKDYIEQMGLKMQVNEEISPTLRTIINQFDENNERLMDTFTSYQKSGEHVDKDDKADLTGDAFDNCGTWNFDHDEKINAADEDPNGVETTFFPSYTEENESFIFDSSNMDNRLESVENFLFLSLGFTSKQNAWAGPDHWKFQKAKALENQPIGEKGPAVKRSKSKKQAEPDIDFTKALDGEMPDIFAPPKNPKTLLLPANRAPCNTKLPEDCHYQPEKLVKLFLLPNKMCLGKRRKKQSDEPRQQFDDCGPLPSWEDDDAVGGQFDDDSGHSNVEDSNSLISQPRQVNKIEVQYDKTSKQVDVQALKETLWHHMQESPQMPAAKVQEDAVSFRDLLLNFPTDCQAATTNKDISPHLCFICLLHLANEHGLSIQGRASLDDLSILLPPKD